MYTSTLQYTCCTQTYNHFTTTTKTNRVTDREQYTRSNAATARPPTSVNTAETLACDGPNTNEQQEMVTKHHLQAKHQIDCDSATCITYSTDFPQRLSLESWFTNFEQTPLNYSKQLTAP